MEISFNAYKEPIKDRNVIVYPSEEFILYIDSKSVGKVSLEHIFSKRKIVHIHSLEIYSSYRGKGYGKILMGEIEKYALSKKKIKLRLGCESDNVIALELYRKSGFKQTGKRSLLEYDELVDYYNMSKTLT